MITEGEEAGRDGMIVEGESLQSNVEIEQRRKREGNVKLCNARDWIALADNEDIF